MAAVLGLAAFVGLASGLAWMSKRARCRADTTPEDLKRAGDGSSDPPFIDYGNPMG